MALWAPRKAASAVLIAAVVALPVAALGQTTATYRYDVHGRLLAATGTGSPWNGWSAYAYDAADSRTVRQKQSLSPPSAVNEMTAYTGLVPGQKLVSPDGRFEFRLQIDGNLALWWGTSLLWQSGTANGQAMWLLMDPNGNLILYPPDTTYSTTVWASGTAGHPGSKLVLQSDGNLVIYDGSTAVWSTGTGGH